MSFRLGIDLGFARNKYQEPEVWTKIVREDLGLGYVSMVADILNPVWPEKYFKEVVKRTKNSIDNYGITVEACFTSALTRVPHLMHYDEAMRKHSLEMFKKFFATNAEFGCKVGGSHFGIMSFQDYNDEDRREFLIEETVNGWQELSFFAKELGYTSLLFEPMSIPRENGTTIANCKELMDRVNANSGIPMKLCLDVGHAPHPSERDPYKWMKELGSVSPLVHLQQTVLHRSNHSPFTEKFNKDGIIKPDKVMKTLIDSGATDALLAFEISHKEHHDSEYCIIEDLKQSVDYWRTFVKE